MKSDWLKRKNGISGGVKQAVGGGEYNAIPAKRLRGRLQENQHKIIFFKF